METVFWSKAQYNWDWLKKIVQIDFAKWRPLEGTKVFFFSQIIATQKSEVCRGWRGMGKESCH